MVQTEAPEFDPDIDGDRPPSTIKKPDEVSIPGTLPTIPEVTESEDENPCNKYSTTNLSRN